jgi:hypothetical protein
MNKQAAESSLLLYRERARILLPISPISRFRIGLGALAILTQSIPVPLDPYRELTSRVQNEGQKTQRRRERKGTERGQENRNKR